MSTSKHILLLTPGFPIDKNDFNCIPPLQEFLIKINQIHPRVDFSIITFQYPYDAKNYSWENINVYPLGGKNSKVKKPFIWLKAIRTAKQIDKIRSVDVLHTLWLGECAMIGNILSKKFDCEHICTLMGQDVKSSNRYLKRLKNSKIRFIALSKNQANQFLRLTNRKVNDIIHWGIDDQPESIIERDIDLLAVGSLIPLKNYSLFVQLVHEIAKINPDIKCKLVGTGPESTNLKIMTKEKGIEHCIEFTGLLSRTEIFKLMQRSKILIHPSMFEGSGFIFAEALANGMYIVSYNVGYAHSHPKWFIANDNQDFIKITVRLLGSKLDFKAVNAFPLQETVNRYDFLYNINEIRKPN
ncbi:MAG: glycosyltransferase family 4 protein [Ignavibacteriaceae bacterium]|nr:glycosyltransferase family 4 protein [Ignavibacteriaceae bacterium]